ncbi:MAG: helix-turn-helix transcriptional regulator [Clostridia bacterium]|nr:helix-turn-helix transcriptional regulator [Clostridia bacterium]
MKTRRLREFDGECYVVNVDYHIAKRRKYFINNDKGFPRRVSTFIFVRSGRIKVTMDSGLVFYADTHCMIYFPEGSVSKSEYCEDMTEVNALTFNLRDSEGPFVFSDEVLLMEKDFAERFENFFNRFMDSGIGENHTLRYTKLVYSFLQALNETNYAYYADEKYRIFLQGYDMLVKTYAENLPVSEFAAAANVSACYLRRLFKHYLGVSPVVFRNRLRLEHVRELLETGQYSIQQAVAESGIESVSYYYRLKKAEDKAEKA